MPLIKSSSKKARQENIRTEIDSGRDPRQAIAIGYSVQREAESRKRKRQEQPQRESYER